MHQRKHACTFRRLHACQPMALEGHHAHFGESRRVPGTAALSAAHSTRPRRPGQLAPPTQQHTPSLPWELMDVQHPNNQPHEARDHGVCWLPTWARTAAQAAQPAAPHQCTKQGGWLVPAHPKVLACAAWHTVVVVSPGGLAVVATGGIQMVQGVREGSVAKQGPAHARRQQLRPPPHTPVCNTPHLWKHTVARHANT
jgi:hypothetical protein